MVQILYSEVIAKNALGAHSRQNFDDIKNYTTGRTEGVIWHIFPFIQIASGHDIWIVFEDT
jgi:hypothetical protein